MLHHGHPVLFRQRELHQLSPKWTVLLVSKYEDSGMFEEDLPRHEDKVIKKKETLPSQASSESLSAQSTSDEDPPSGEESEFYSHRRSSLRRLMKLEFVGYVAYILVNVLVGY